MKSRRNRVAAWWTLFALFFAQVATAAYACPLLQQPPVAPVAEIEMVTPCPGMDPSTPEPASALCVEHCKAGKQLVDNHPPTEVPAIAPNLLFFVATLVANGDVSARAPEPVLVRAAAPPIYFSSSRLRI